MKTIFCVYCSKTIITIIITAIQDTIGNFSPFDFLSAGLKDVDIPVIQYPGIEEITN